MLHWQMPSEARRRAGGQILPAEWQVALMLGLNTGLLSPAAENKEQPRGLLFALIQTDTCVCLFLCMLIPPSGLLRRQRHLSTISETLKL